MRLVDLMSQLQQLDIRLSMEDNRLRCNAPKGALTPELRETLAARKAEIITFLQTDSAARSAVIPSFHTIKIEPAERQGNPPLSLAQKRLWFLDQYDPGNTAYSIPAAIQFEGMLDTAILEKCLNEITRRHESLRTSFATNSSGQPEQVIHPPAWVKLPIVAFPPLDGTEQDAASRKFMEAQARIPFDLKTGPLVRATLVRLSETCHWLFINMHHIISDGWSIGLLFTELAALYQAYTSGQANPLEDLPIQYADYAIWQRQAMGPQALSPQLAYWKQALSGKLPILELPADRPREKILTTNGATFRMVLPDDLLSQVKQEASKQSVTLFILLEAAFNVLLYRYTGQEDIIVGTANANRDRQEVERLIGFFANTLALRFNLSGDPTFADFLKHVRDVSLEAFANHAVPFESIVEALQPERDTCHTPIFQVMFLLQNIPYRKITFTGLNISPVIFQNGTAKYDLTLSIWENPEEGLTCEFEYNTGLFNPETIQRMSGHYLTLLKAACADPALKISQMPMLTESERRQILCEWNATQMDYPDQMTLPELFEAQAARAPGRVAVSDEQAAITYAELDRRANQLARHLQTLGAGPETLVGISLPRGIDLLVSLLAIQKAGAAYLPLDPYFPADRLVYMLEDSHAPLLITQTDLAARFATSPARMICLDADAAAIRQRSDRSIEKSAGPDNLAYLLYTSGSTGRPKGVQVTQRNLVNLLSAMQRQPGLSAQDVFLAVTTLSFDIAGLELYLPLITGARVALVSSTTAADGALLKQAMEQHGATIMQATPATWRLLIAAGWQGSASFKVLCGGEALLPDLATLLLERCGSLWNMYGPTETTIWSTTCRITAPDQALAIGRPIGNTQVYILDAHGQPTPIGIPGELYIGGDGVARGYLNRAALTDEKFILDPFRHMPNARLYRTGDMARYLPDGQIAFLGRIDNQVKLRGFRIELGEIESALAQHPAVSQGVVTLREDTPGDQRLVAYLIARTAPPSTSELRVFLGQTLPEYMLPSIFVFLAALPLTPNGKVDRRALPAPEASRPELAANFVAPRSAIEQTLAAIWQQALKVEKVGIHDNFFELGGHSLLLVQIHWLISQQFQTDLTIAQMFQYPTIHSLAQYLNRSPGDPVQVSHQHTIDRAMLQQEAIQRQKKLLRRGRGDV